MITELKTLIKQKLVTKSKLVVLNYHQLGDIFDQKIHNKYIWNNVSRFEEEMIYLKKNFEIVSLKDGLELLKTGGIKKTLVSVTFDDGDASIASLAMPLLDQLAIPGTFFINTAYGVEKMGYWYNLGPYLENKELIEASETIRNTQDPKIYHELLKLENVCNEKNVAKKSPFYSDFSVFENCTNPLFHFGLHGHEHFRFSMLSRDKQKENLKKNIDAMSHWPNYVPYFAVPFGKPKDWNKDTLSVSEELGVIPFLAYYGYNTKYRIPFLRTSADTKKLVEVFKNFSISQKTYDNLNGIN